MKLIYVMNILVYSIVDSLVSLGKVVIIRYINYLNVIKRLSRFRLICNSSQYSVSFRFFFFCILRVILRAIRFVRKLTRKIQKNNCTIHVDALRGSVSTPGEYLRSRQQRDT